MNCFIYIFQAIVLIFVAMFIIKSYIAASKSKIDEFMIRLYNLKSCPLDRFLGSVTNCNLSLKVLVI